MRLSVSGRGYIVVKEFILAVIAAAGIPSSLLAFFVWNIQRKITKREAERDKAEEKRLAEEKQKEEAREQHELLLIQGVGASLSLGEATARAVQRIPDAHCNGDMHAVKHKQRDFLAKQGVTAMFE